jgi:outer membrane protein assembly factor BamB
VIWQYFTSKPIFSSACIVKIPRSEYDQDDSKEEALHQRPHIDGNCDTGGGGDDNDDDVNDASGDSYDGIAFGCHDGVLRCVSAATGALIWEHDVQSVLFSSPTVVYVRVPEGGETVGDNTTYKNTGCNGFISDGSEPVTGIISESREGLHGCTNYVQLKSGTLRIPLIVCATTSGRVVVVNGLSGAPVCEHTLPGEIYSSPVIVTATNVSCVRHENDDVRDGRQDGQDDSDDYDSDSDAISIYIGARDDRVRRLTLRYV